MLSLNVNIDYEGETNWEKAPKTPMKLYLNFIQNIYLSPWKTKAKHRKLWGARTCVENE